MFGKTNKVHGASFGYLIAACLLTMQVFAQTPTNGSTGPASLKDSDLDGLSDNAETVIYKTNPNVADTDGDGIIDSQEIMDGTNPVDEKSNGALSVLNKNEDLLRKL